MKHQHNVSPQPEVAATSSSLGHHFNPQGQDRHSDQLPNITNAPPNSQSFKVSTAGDVLCTPAARATAMHTAGRIATTTAVTQFGSESLLTRSFAAGQKSAFAIGRLIFAVVDSEVVFPFVV
jgi:hypothetical protein